MLETRTRSLPIRNIKCKRMDNARENMRYRQPHVKPSLREGGQKTVNFPSSDKAGMGVTMSCGEVRRGTWGSVWGQESKRVTRRDATSSGQ